MGLCPFISYFYREKYIIFCRWEQEANQEYMGLDWKTALGGNLSIPEQLNGIQNGKTVV